MGEFITIALLLLGHAQTKLVGPAKLVGPQTIPVASASCLPYPDSFPGSTLNPSFWTTPVSTGATDTVTASGGTAVTTGSGLAVLTGCGVVPRAQTAQLVFPTVGDFTGPCVLMDTLGNGFCWLLNAEQIYVITTGIGNHMAVDCRSGSGQQVIVSNNDTVKLSSNSSGLLTGTDVTTGISCSGTDTTFTSGSPAIFVWSGFPVSSFVGSSP